MSVVSPASRFAYIEVVSPTFVSGNILWRWMNITVCSQLRSLWSYFQLNSEILRLLTEVGRFQKWRFHPLICALRPVRLLWWKGGRKENRATTVICEQTNLIVQGGTRFASPRNVFPRLDSVSIHVSGYTTAARSVLPFVTAVTQKGFLALVNKLFALNAQSFHFLAFSWNQILHYGRL